MRCVPSDFGLAVIILSSIHPSSRTAEVQAHHEEPAWISLFTCGAGCYASKDVVLTMCRDCSRLRLLLNRIMEHFINILE